MLILRIAAVASHYPQNPNPRLYFRTGAKCKTILLTIMRRKILVVDDDLDKLGLLRQMLEREAYQVMTARSGEEALALLPRVDPDLVLLDVHFAAVADATMMDGIEICQRIRRFAPYHYGGQKRIMMFSDKRTGSADKVTGLYAGADRYLVRPVAPEELLAEIRALLLTISDPIGELAPQTIHVDDGLAIYADERVVLAGGKKRTLQNKQFELLLYLAEHLNRARSKDEIIIRVWSYKEDENVLTKAVRHIRLVIEPDPDHPIYLKTIHGYGYKLVVPDVHP